MAAVAGMGVGLVESAGVSAVPSHGGGSGSGGSIKAVAVDAFKVFDLMAVYGAAGL
jgi:hypothetical protein